MSESPLVHGDADPSIIRQYTAYSSTSLYTVFYMFDEYGDNLFEDS